jgi:hypothetical protein
VTISLEKRSADATDAIVVNLQKAAAKGHDLGEVTAQVILVFDYSGSMARFFERGEVQELTERILGLSLPLDDDGNIQVFPFDHRAYEPFVVDAGSYSGVIEDWRHERGRFGSGQQQPPKRGLFKRREPVLTGPSRRARLNDMGGTDYSVVIEKILTYTAEEGMLDAGKPPVFVLFQSDGGTNDPDKTQKLLTTAANLPIFWQFLGLGSSTGFLSTLDNLPGRVVDNVGKTSVPSVKGTAADEFYQDITREFVTEWLPAVRGAGILR